MKHDLPPLDGLKVFESAARQLSFSQAAQELCMTKGAVSYQIKKLEESLDCALFRRSTRQVFLTNAGQQLLQATQHLFLGLSRTLSQIKPADSSYDVHVGVTTYVALRWLSSRISRFSEYHPDVSILLQHAVNSGEFKMQDVDFIVRWEWMLGQKKRGFLLELPMPLFPACSPKLLERAGFQAGSNTLEVVDITSPKLASIPLLCEDRDQDLWQEWYGVQSRALSNPRRMIADANVRTQAAVDGMGWTLADELMRVELDSGALVSPFSYQLKGHGYTIQSAQGRFINQNALALRNWLIEQP